MLVRTSVAPGERLRPKINSITVPGLCALGGITLPVTSQSFNGFIGGGQAGYNWQSGIVVFGVEGEIAGTNAKGTAPCLVVLSCESKQNWMATAAARLGLADGRDLYYVKGGAAWSHNTYSANLNILLSANTEVSDNRWGWLVGAGLEHAFTPALSAKLEYDYIDYGSQDYNFPLACSASDRHRNQDPRVPARREGWRELSFRRLLIGSTNQREASEDVDPPGPHAFEMRVFDACV